MAAGTAKVLFEAGRTGTLTSPDGDVTITVSSGAIDSSVNLTYIPLEATQLPSLPEGSSVANVAFDLVPSTVLDVEIDDFDFNTPIEVAIRLSGTVLDVAQSRPNLITVQHYKTSSGWSELPTRLDLSAGTIFAQVSSLSIFALLVEEDDSADKEPNIQEPTATVTPAPTPTPTSIAALVLAATPTSTASPAPTVAQPTTEAEVIPSPTPVGTQPPAAVLIPAPVLVTPTDGRRLSDDTPTFEWLAVEGDDVTYELQISLRNDFSPLVLNEVTPATSLTVPRSQRLDPDDYNWRVRAILSGVEGPFSVDRSLTIRRSGGGGGGGGEGGSDPTATNTPSPTSTPTPSANLSITKVDDVDPVTEGDDLTYTITVSNAGPSAAQNVVVTDTLPSGVTPISTSGCSQDPSGVPVCALGNLAASASASFTITVNVEQGTSGIISNIASVTSSLASCFLDEVKLSTSDSN